MTDPPPTPVPSGAADLGVLVRTRRERALLTQEQLAERAGLSVRTVRGVESGRIRRPRSTSLRLLADALGLTGRDRDDLVAAAQGRTPDPAAVAGPPAGPLAVPAQLPPDLAAFTGRRDQVRRLDALLPAGTGAAEPVPIAVISGTAGVGKTALAVHWSHRVRTRFPDGQLFLNLRGFDPAGTPLTPGQGIRILLDALQVPPQRIPGTLDAQVGLYRSWLDGRRVLVVLDNASGAEQVRPLLPAGDGCMAVVTSRNQLLSLVAAEGAQPLPLDLLPRGGARELLAHRLGAGRLAGEPAATEELITRSAGLPLALAMVAARAAVHPGFRLGELAAELSRADSVLDRMGEPGTSTDLRTVFSWSYHALSPAAARLFRLLSLHPGPDLATATAASLAGVPVPETAGLLAELRAASLVTEPAPGRYALHDLLSAYARELAARADADTDRREAQHRMLDHYLHTADTTTRLLNLSPTHPTGPPRPEVTPVPLATAGDAQRWFRTERVALLGAIRLAADAGFDSHASQLAQALIWFLDQAGHWVDQRQVQQVALAAAERLADPATLAQAHRRLGIAHGRLAEWPEAERHLRQALDIFVELDEPIALARVHSALGALFEQRGDYDRALAYVRQAVEFARFAGNEAAQARCLNALGWCLALCGRYRETIVHCEQALAIHQRIEDPAGAAKAWDTLGFAHLQLGNPRLAIDYYQRSLRLLDRHDSRYDRAEVLAHLGDAHHAAGEPAAARKDWEAALAVATELGTNFRSAAGSTAVADLRAKLQDLADR